MDWKLTEKKRVHDGHFKVDQLSLDYDSYAGKRLQNVKREIVGRQDAVAVIPFDPQRETVVLIEQFRAGAIGSDNPWITEIVAGLIEADESTEEVARRETQEETGCEAKRLKEISKFYTSPGGLTEHMTLFIAEVDSAAVMQHAGLADEQEDIQVSVVSMHRIADLLADGEINSATPIIGLQWLLLNREQILAEWQ